MANHDMVGPGQASPLPDVLLGLDEEYASILALLDRPAAIGRIVAKVPELSGVDTAWVGEATGPDQILLQHAVNTYTDGINGLTVPIGAGLGGKVLIARRPMWVPDYCQAADITNHFKKQVEDESVKSMIAVPVVHNGQLLGVLYGANRSEMAYGDRTTRALEEMAARLATAQIVAERARHAAEVAVHEERRRLAVDLHDTVGAMLFTLRAGLQRLSDEPKLDETIRERLAAIEQQAMEASAALRGSLQVLHAPPEQVALGVALREHCRAFTDRTGIPARVITLTELPTLARARIGALADGLREALLNIEKHARAQSVVITVFASRGGVAVAVSDDGVGLDDDYASGDGLGLASLTERISWVGGTASVMPNDDGGVTVHAWVPA